MRKLTKILAVALGLAAVAGANAAIAQDADTANTLDVTVPVSLSDLTEDVIAVSVACEVFSGDGEPFALGQTFLIDDVDPTELERRYDLVSTGDDFYNIVTTLEGYSGDVVVTVEAFPGYYIDAWASGTCSLDILSADDAMERSLEVRFRRPEFCGESGGASVAHCRFPGSEGLTEVTFQREGLSFNEDGTVIMPDSEAE